MVCLTQDKFLTELPNLFDSTRESGSLSLTFKRGALSFPAAAVCDETGFVSLAVSEKAATEGEEGDAAKTARHRCLIRARTDKKKISTVVWWNSRHTRERGARHRSRPRTC